ncbi:hypothetical protein FB451DRAFT_1215862 [Mycena latifolia]|nr:hypothetical protein FB451DRAFT_1215862 [Mycena latifolia]
MKNLAPHRSTAGAVMDLYPDEQLVIQLYTDDYPWHTLGYLPCETLEALANSPSDAGAVVAAKVLDLLREELVSRWASVRESACTLLAALARYESTAPAVACAVPREQLVALSRDEDFGVALNADRALQALDDYLASAQAPNDDAGEPNVP